MWRLDHKVRNGSSSFEFSGSHVSPEKKVTVLRPLLCGFGTCPLLVAFSTDQRLIF